MGVPPRFLERFVLSWDSGGMSQEWLLAQLEDTPTFTNSPP